MATTSLKRVPTSLVIREMPTQTKVNVTNLQRAKDLNRNLSKEGTQKKKTKRETDHPSSVSSRTCKARQRHTTPCIPTTMTPNHNTKVPNASERQREIQKLSSIPDRNTNSEVTLEKGLWFYTKINIFLSQDPAIIFLGRYTKVKNYCPQKKNCMQIV